MERIAEKKHARRAQDVVEDNSPPIGGEIGGVKYVTDLFGASIVDRTCIISEPFETDWAKVEPSATHTTTWEISTENKVDSSPKLPENALAAQEKFKKESTRCFILYRGGKDDYGITPCSDMQIERCRYISRVPYIYNFW